MSQKKAKWTYDGQAVRQQQIQNTADVAGSADDYALADVFRTGSGSSGVRRPYILPGSGPGFNSTNATILTPSATAMVVNVNPFRAMLSDASSTANHHGMVSGVFAGSTLGPIAANSSGSDRYDLVYAVVTLLDPQSTDNVPVKDPTSGVESVLSVPLYTQTTVTVGYAVGTPGAGIPALPASSASVYNVLIGAIKVPNGYTSASVFATSDIREGYQVPAGIAQPANKHVAAVADATTGIARRNGCGMQPSQAGMEMRIVNLSSSSVSQQYASGSVLDDSIDWRNRRFVVLYQSSVDYTKGFVGNTTNAAAIPGVDNGLGLTFHGNSYHNSSTGRLTVCNVTNSFDVNMPAGHSIEIYVDGTDGTLRVYRSDNTFNHIATAVVMAFGMEANPYA